MTQHPVRLVVTDDLKRSRLTVLFRLLLVVPHFTWLYIWGWGAWAVLVINWFATLFAGRPEEDVHSFLGRYIRYQTHINAYLWLLANPYPRFHGRPGSYPIDLEIDPPQRQNRWVTGFRLLLVIPAFVLASVLGVVLELVGFLGWFACLALGRMPKGMRDLGAYCLRYQAQNSAYFFLLTSRYPSLASGVTAEGELRSS